MRGQKTMKKLILWGIPQGNFYGKQHSEESKQKMKKPKIKVVCPYCGKIGGLPVMKRFHFDKCKHKINTTL